MSNLEQEFKWYLQNQNDLVDQYEGKFLVIKKTEILGVFEDKMEAIKETMREYKCG